MVGVGGWERGEQEGGKDDKPFLGLSLPIYRRKGLEQWFSDCILQRGHGEGEGKAE